MVMLVEFHRPLMILGLILIVIRAALTSLAPLFRYTLTLKKLEKLPKDLDLYIAILRSALW